MAGLITIVAASEIPTAIFTNVHAFNEINKATNFKPKLIVWRDQFFPILIRNKPGQAASLNWAVPTEQLINSMLPNTNTEPPAYMDPIINMVQNTFAGLGVAGFASLTAPQLADMVAAFNTAWT